MRGGQARGGRHGVTWRSVGAAAVGGRTYVPLTKSPTSGKLCELPRDLELSKDMLIGLAQRGGRAGGGWALDDDTSCLLQRSRWQFTSIGGDSVDPNPIVTPPSARA